ncbi:Questin oxidase [Frankliniella fusca]|uniref:Questin oxidase n=1 Tax=Frankliniella fusca TaxID=407009 RepID=A0AAE1LI54_9NEOP|nr:Questin oxidase [Frankliniella fusca]
MANNEEAVIQAAGIAVMILEEKEEELQHALLVLAQIAVREIMELEEPWIDAGALEASWIYVNVNINEYHLFPDPVFKIHFRMSRGVFEILVQTVGNHLRSKGRLRRVRTPLQDILLMVVWIMATPDSFRSVALRFGRRPSTLWDFYSYC